MDNGNNHQNNEETLLKFTHSDPLKQMASSTTTTSSSSSVTTSTASVNHHSDLREQYQSAIETADAGELMIHLPTGFVLKSRVNEYNKCLD